MEFAASSRAGIRLDSQVESALHFTLNAAGRAHEAIDDFILNRLVKEDYADNAAVWKAFLEYQVAKNRGRIPVTPR